jgi:hypothetical protein
MIFEQIRRIDRIFKLMDEIFINLLSGSEIFVNASKGETVVAARKAKCRIENYITEAE